MSLHRIVIASVFALSLGLAGCGGGAGNSCVNDDECGSGLICAELAICGPDATECSGVCGQPCDTHEDCPEGVLCGASIGGEEICQESETRP